jgi:uncharacterized cupredoxin-like copper-binding protein
MATPAGHAAFLAVSIVISTSVASRAIASEPITVSVVMTDYKFNPDHVEFQRGTRYRLHLENAGKELHEFTAADFFKSAAIENPEVLNADHTDAVIPPHESKDVILVPRRKGSSSSALTTTGMAWSGASWSNSSSTAVANDESLVDIRRPLGRHRCAGYSPLCLRSLDVGSRWLAMTDGSLASSGGIRSAGVVLSECSVRDHENGQSGHRDQGFHRALRPVCGSEAKSTHIRMQLADALRRRRGARGIPLVLNRFLIQRKVIAPCLEYAAISAVSGTNGGSDGTRTRDLRRDRPAL